MRNGKYELVVAPEEYPGKKYRNRYCYEHHLVWWINTKELIVENETLIHHKDGNKRNNSFLNLEKVTLKRHNKVHSKGRTFVKLTCSCCGKAFKREKRNVHSYNNYYCNRSCMGKHYWVKKRSQVP